MPRKKVVEQPTKKITFDPKDDITLAEISIIVVMSMGGLARPILEIYWDKLNDNVKRHFVVSD